MPTLLLVCSSLLLSLHTSVPTDSVPPVIPACSQAAYVPGPSFKISAASKIVLGTGTGADDRFAASLLVEALRQRKDIALRTVSEDALRSITSNYILLGTPSAGFLKRELRARQRSAPGNSAPEGYTVDVAQRGILIAAGSYAGRLRGIQSLIQLITTEKKSLVVPAITISDHPRTAFRGATVPVHNDDATTAADVKEMIRTLCEYKMNALVIPWQNEGSVWDSTSSFPLAGPAVRELEEYGRLRGIELIPSVFIDGPDAIHGDAFAAMFRSQKIFVQTTNEGGQAPAADAAQTLRANAHMRSSRKTFFADAGAYSVFSHLPGVSLDRVTLVAHANDLDSLVRCFEGAERQHIATLAMIDNPAQGTLFPTYDSFAQEIEAVTQRTPRELNGILLTACRHAFAPRSHEFERLAIAWTAETAWSGPSTPTNTISERFFRQEFGTGTSVLLAQTCYAFLSDPSARVNESIMFSHPFSEESNLSVERLQRIAPIAVAAANELESLALKNIKHARQLTCTARLVRWFGNSAALAARILRAGRSGAPVQFATFVNAAVELRRNLDSLSTRSRSEFPAAGQLEEMVPRLSAWWEGIERDLRKNAMPSVPLSPADWITIRPADATTGIASSASTRAFRFQKDIQLEEQVQDGWMQVFSSIEPDIIVNGVKIRPEAFGTEASQRLRSGTYRLTKFLRHGRNTIEIRIKSAGSGKIPHVNAYGEFILSGGMVDEIATDTTWSVAAAGLPDEKEPPTRASVVRKEGVPMPVLREDVRSRRTVLPPGEQRH